MGEARMFVSRIAASILLAALYAGNHAPLQEQPTLQPGVPFERQLAGGETHSYRISLKSGQFLRIEVEQHRIDVLVSLTSAAAQQLAVSNRQYAVVERVSTIAETDTELRLEVRAANPADASGRYIIRLAEARAANGLDRDLVKADLTFAAAHQLLEQEALTARRSAVEKLEESLALYRKAGDRRGELFALYSLGRAYTPLGERRKTLEAHEQALPLARSLSERLLESHLMQDLGSLCYSLNQVPQALEYFQQVLPLLRELSDRAREAQALFSLGVVQGGMGDRVQANASYQQAQLLWKALEDRAGEARALAAIGAGYEVLGEKQKAIETMERALPLLRSVGDHNTEANTLYSLGLAYDTLNERQKAVTNFSLALALRKEFGHPDGAAGLNRVLGSIYDGLGDLQQALAHSKQALALFEAERDHRATAGLLRNIGLLHNRLGEREQALAHFKRALPLFRLGADKQSLARLLANLGEVHSELGEHDEALRNLNEALPILQQINNQFFEVYTLYWIARAERGRGHLAAARARAEENLAKVEHLRRSFYQADLRAVAFTKARDFYELELDLLVRLGEDKVDQKLFEAALEVSEQARARTMLDLLAEARTGIRTGITPELQQRESANQTRLASLQSQLIQLRQQARPDQKRIGLLQQELAQADEERAQLEHLLRRQHPQYADMLYPAPLRVEAMRNLLDERTALLEYVLGQEHSFLFVLTREGVHCRRLPAASEINELVQEVRQALGQPGQTEFARFTQAAGRLYELLVAPVASVLDSKSKLLIAPDGVLYYLPFESLPAKIVGQQRMDYLIKRWTVSYIPSASVLASLRLNKRPVEAKGGIDAAKQFVAFADPVYPPRAAEGVVKTGDPSDKEERWDLVRLVESAREVTEIARLYRPEQTALFLRAQATEENIKGNQALASARRIHFATHGLISTTRPQHSALVMTLDDDPREDGLLQMWEIFNLRLQADLVVLSACQTGLGRAVTGEGILGLTRAFMYAGTPSVVASLWNVADRSTAELMVKFYRGLDRTFDKAEALREAKLELMRNPRYASPYYWAPFVLIGEPK
jgi:CHAT domain-containing protein/tetratricopeptide (TPR) repeat protein